MERFDLEDEVDQARMADPTRTLDPLRGLVVLDEIQPTQGDLEGHPKVGASFEGFAIEQVIRFSGADPEECFFWATGDRTFTMAPGIRALSMSDLASGLGAT